MKRLVLLAAIAAAGFATNASAEILFQGSILIRSVTPGCHDFQAGWHGRSQYHPRGAGNQNFTAISILFDFSGSSYGLSGGDFTTTFKNVGTAATFWGPVSWTGSQVRLSAPRNPTTITSATHFVTLIGQIKRPENDPGGASCIASFEANYLRDPNN